MLRRTCTALAAEFKQKSRWSKVWPTMRYGALYLMFSSGRNIPMSGVNWVTRDSNRLASFKSRYQSVIDELDTAKNEEVMKVAPQDVRWNDHRELWFKCRTCGRPYQQCVSSVTKFHAGCLSCRRKHSSEILQEQVVATPLETARPDLATTLSKDDKAENIAKFGVTSKFVAKWNCSCCGRGYFATIRTRTGQVEPGQAPVSAICTEMSKYCNTCSWAQTIGPQGKRAMQVGQLTGLESQVEANKVEAKVPRRKRFV